MAFLDDLVNVSISATTKNPTGAGYGTLLIAAYHTHYGDRVRTYTDLAGMVSDGFSVTEPAYLAAQVAFSQNPRPVQIKVGRRALAPAQAFTIELLDGTPGDNYAFKVNGKSVTYTNSLTGATGATAQYTAAQALTASLKTAVGTGSTGATFTQGTGATGATSTSNIIYVNVVTAGQLMDVTIDTAGTYSRIKVANTTPDPGIATDLAAIALADNDWYGLALDSNGAAEVKAAAAYVEANKKLAAFDTSDSAVYDGTITSDVMSSLQTSGYTRSGVWFNDQMLSYLGAGIAAQRLTSNPGSDTWANKSVAGVAVSQVTEPQSAAIKLKGGNTYVRTSGVNLTLYGQGASGEFYDLVRFIDWLGTTMQIAYLSLLVNSAKIPFTDAGGDLLQSILSGVLQQGINAGGLAANPAPVVNVPKVATITTANRTARNFTPITFSGTLAGAVHSLVITGVLST